MMRFPSHQLLSRQNLAPVLTLEIYSSHGSQHLFGYCRSTFHGTQVDNMIGTLRRELFINFKGYHHHHHNPKYKRTNHLILVTDCSKPLQIVFLLDFIALWE